MDVRLDSLFRTTTTIEVTGRALYLRALSEFDLQARDDHAVRAMARTRNGLADPQSESYEKFLSWLPTLKDEELANIAISSEQATQSRLSLIEITPKIIPFPDDADDAEKARVIQAREAEEHRVVEERKRFVEDAVKGFQASIKELGHDQLIALARERQIDVQSRVASIRAYEDYTIYASVFTDEAFEVRLVNSPEKAKELMPDVRMALLAHYAQLDTVSPLELQYFLSTTDSPASSRPVSGSERPTRSKGGKPQKT